MVTILRRQPQKSQGERLSEGIGQGLDIVSGMMKERESAQNRKKENAKFKELTGENLDDIVDPKARNKAFELAYGAKLKGDQKQTDFDKRQDLVNKIMYGQGNQKQPQQDQNFGMNEEIEEKLRQAEEMYGELSPETKQELIQSWMGGGNDMQGQDYQQEGQEIDPNRQAEAAAAIGEHDLARVYSDRAKNQSKEVSSSWKENKPYIDKTMDQYEDSLRREAILERMGQLEESGELSGNGIYNALQQLGLNEEWLKNPANEEYNKLGLDLLGGGSLQADYGSRVLQSEFKVSQQRIPTLSQTPEGRKQIRENIEAMLLPARLKQERMQYYLDRSERTGKPLPHNLRGQVIKDIKPKLEEAYDKFKQRNGRYKVKEGTAIDDNSMEKYYYISDGNVEKAKKMMKEDGYAV